MIAYTTWTVEPHPELLGVFKVTPYPTGATWGDVERAAEAMRALLEAAPELLVALERLCADPFDNERRDHARAVIRKAGGTP
jgi:hypothetical protein